MLPSRSGVEPVLMRPLVCEEANCKEGLKLKLAAVLKLARNKGCRLPVACVTLILPNSLFHSFTGVLLLVLGKMLPVTFVLALNQEERWVEIPPGDCAATLQYIPDIISNKMPSRTN